MLDRGSDCHQIKDTRLLQDATDCGDKCFIAASDGGTLQITKTGSVDIRVKAMDVFKTIRLLDVHFAFNSERSIISFGSWSRGNASWSIAKGGV